MRWTNKTSFLDDKIEFFLLIFFFFYDKNPTSRLNDHFLGLFLDQINQSIKYLSRENALTEKISLSTKLSEIQNFCCDKVYMNTWWQSFMAKRFKKAANQGQKKKVTIWTWKIFLPLLEPLLPTKYAVSFRFHPPIYVCLKLERYYGR